MDVLECRKALQERNIARALLLYRGEVLPEHFYSSRIWKWREQIKKPLRATLRTELESAFSAMEFIGLPPAVSVYEEWLDELSWGTIGAAVEGWTD